MASVKLVRRIGEVMAWAECGGAEGWPAHMDIRTKGERARGGKRGSRAGGRGVEGGEGQGCALTWTDSMLSWLSPRAP